MIKEVRYKGNNLHVGSTEGFKEIDLKYKIWNVLTYNNKIFVLFEPDELYGREINNKNIICLDEGGETVWKIENIDALRPSGTKTDSPFVGMSLGDNGILHVRNWDGYFLNVDMNTGKLSNPRWTK